MQDLQKEINNIKKEIKEIKQKNLEFESKFNSKNNILEKENSISSFENIQQIIKEKKEEDKNQYLNAIQRIQFHKWICQINLVIGTDFHKTFQVLIDSGADLNCIQEGLIPTKYYQKMK